MGSGNLIVKKEKHISFDVDIQLVDGKAELFCLYVIIVCLG
jgi:hypothetical protein